jgi:hypothetical protein
MSDKTYPYQAWTLTPSYALKEVTISKPYGSVVFHGDMSDGGKYYPAGELFASRDEALDEADRRLWAQNLALDKAKVRIEKRRANVAKARQS